MSGSLINTVGPHETPRYATMVLTPTSDSGIKGMCSFTQTSEVQPVQVHCAVSGLSPNSKHGFHVHAFGDISGHNCLRAKGHFNPDGTTHGGLFDEVRHLGDFGNIISNIDGFAILFFNDSRITLFGEESIIGSAIVLHAGEDDLGRGGN